MSSAAALQQLLQQLHTHVASSPQALTASSTSAVPTLPEQWYSTHDLIRTLRSSLTRIYASVLTQEEKDHATVKFGWKESDQRINTDHAAATASAPSHASEHTVEAISAATSASVSASASTSLIPVSSSASSSTSSIATFHRFNIPLVELTRQFQTARASIGHITSYHHALINAVQTASKSASTPGGGGTPQTPTTPNNNNPASQQLQSIARTYLVYLKLRLDLQKQHLRVSDSFQCVQERIQQEMQQRKYREFMQLKSVTDQALLTDSQHQQQQEYHFPSRDLFALVSSLESIRSALHLTNGLEDPGLAHTTEAQGAFTVSNHATINGRVLEDPATMNSTLISSTAFSFEKHKVNISSTGADTCFVLDIEFLRPIVRTDEDRATVASLISQVRAMPNGIASLHAGSSLSQLLHHGFCIYGTLILMLGPDSLLEIPLDHEFIERMYASDFTSVRAKIALLLVVEQLSEANPSLLLYEKRDVVVKKFQELATSTLPSTSFFRNELRFDTRVEGPCLYFSSVGIPSVNFNPMPGSLTRNEELSMTYVGVEQVQQMNDANAMDTSSSTTPTFLYRFLLSYPLALPRTEIERLFGADYYASTFAAPASHSGNETEPSYHAVCTGDRHSFDSSSDTPRSYIQTLFDSRQSYTPPTGASPSLVLTSFLVRDLNLLPSLITSFRQFHRLQRIYRSCFEGVSTVNEAATIEQPILAHRDQLIATLPMKSKSKSTQKLKFSYRSLLDDVEPEQANMDVFKTEKVESGIAVQLQLVEQLSHLQVHTQHPITRAPLIIDIQCNLLGELSIPVNIVCENGRVPSNAYATQLLNVSGSIPSLVHYVLKKAAQVK